MITWPVAAIIGLVCGGMALSIGVIVGSRNFSAKWVDAEQRKCLKCREIVQALAEARAERLALTTPPEPREVPDAGCCGRQDE